MKNLLFILIFILLLNNVLAAENVTSENLALTCLKESKTIMTQMSDSGFNVLRINDSIKQAQNIFDLQTLLKERKKTYDFNPILAYCDDIKKLQIESINARDDLDVLLKVYNDSIVVGMNTSEIDFTINQIKLEISNERYENVKDLIDKGYSEISNLKSSYTGVNIFYANAVTGIAGFFLARNKILQIENWKIISFLIILLLFFFLVYRTKIRKMRINRKIASLRMRKDTVKNLIMQLQKNYFENNKIPEGEYNIRTKKFAEIIRDIDRQIPLLQEELARIESRKNRK